MLIYSLIVVSIVGAWIVSQGASSESRLRRKRQRVNRKPVTRANRPTVQLFTRVR